MSSIDNTLHVVQKCVQNSNMNENCTCIDIWVHFCEIIRSQVRSTLDLCNIARGTELIANHCSLLDYFDERYIDKPDKLTFCSNFLNPLYKFNYIP